MNQTVDLTGALAGVVTVAMTVAMIEETLKSPCFAQNVSLQDWHDHLSVCRIFERPLTSYLQPDNG